MTSKSKPTSRLWRTVCSSLLFLLAIFPLDRAAAQGLPLCSWPFEVTGRGLTNVATPDTNATYWVMPLDTNRWSTAIIDGRYPNARFFNLSTYEATGSLVDSVIDASIKPAVGMNPFTAKLPQSEDNSSNTYQIRISRAPTSGNNLRLGGSRLEFLVYRVYAADSTYDRTGGAEVPSVTLVAPNGTTRKLQPCPFADTDSSLANLILLLRVNGFTDAANFLQGVLMAADQLRFHAGSCTGQQPPVSLEFAIATLGADFFPNPQTTLETSGFCFQPGKAVVVTGRAPVFPDTYSGAPVFDPAPPFNNASIQLRYWSMCNNNREIPYAVVGCKADFETAIQNTGSQNQPIYTYTYIVSADLAPPDWLPENTNWLPWGATDIAKNLIFRGILPQDPFALTNHYYPHAVFCDVDRTFRPVSPLPVRGCNRRDDFEQPDVGWLTRQGLLAISMLRSSSFLHSSSVCSQS